MNPGNLTDAGGQLKMASDKLEEAWQAARENWNDVVSRTMEEEQLQPLLQEIRSSLDAIARIGIVLTTACRDCADEREG